MTQRNLVRAVVLAHSLLAAVAFAQPTQMSFTGNLSNSGAPTTGAHNFVFTLYDAPTGGTQAWTETQNGLVVNNGVVITNLGATTALTPAILNGAPLHLEVSVDGTVLSPRVAVLSSPYSVRSAVSNTSATLGSLAPADVQRRVVGTCSSGNAMQVIDASGNVTCVAVGTGDITSVTAGSGITGGALVGDATIAVDGTVQRRGGAPNNMACVAGQYINAISGTGVASCATDLDTGVNAVTPNAGIGASIAGRTLTISNTGVTSLSSANAFITATPASGVGPVTVTANVGSVANTLAAGNHGHNLNCGYRSVAAASGATSVTAACAAGEQLTGGGCNANGGSLIDSYPFQSCPPTIFCICFAGQKCSSDSWACSYTGGTSLVAYAFCCDSPVRGNVP